MQGEPVSHDRAPDRSVRTPRPAGRGQPIGLFSAATGPYHGAVCADDGPRGQVPAVLHDFEPDVEIALEPVDSVVVTALMDSVTDIFMPDQGPARRAPVGVGPRRPSAVMAEEEVPDALIAEHGFSVLVTVTRAGREHRFLFDAGTSPDGVVENMRRLGIDPLSIEAIVCSHGHFDHTTGIDGLIRAVGRANMPVLIHPHFWRRRRVVLPGRDPMEIPTTSRGALAAAGFEIIEERQPSFLFDRSVLVTGEVPRTTGYEPGFPVQQARIGGRWQADPLVLDDQALIMNVAGQGLVVITGCGHAGVVNIARYAHRLTAGQPLYALLGGFHLNGPLFEPLIPRVLDELEAMNPRVLVPAHCTGWRAQHAMSARLPTAFIPNTVGTTFYL
jgi:7,8-dihydropterin-6-yl-methyl-4-(beta-D-ribofuranosyl)aminobenzene 5'-phosphate synthase